jgi:hypothetical protein
VVVLDRFGTTGRVEIAAIVVVRGAHLGRYAGY